MAGRWDLGEIAASGTYGTYGTHGTKPTNLPSTLAAVVPVLQPGAGHALSDSAVFDEVALEMLYLSIKEEVRLMNEAEREVRDNFGRPRLDDLPELLRGS